MTPSRFKIVHIVSGFDAKQPGGVQGSARLAWQALHEHALQSGQPGALICYGDDAGMVSTNGGVRKVITRNRVMAVARVLAQRWPSETLLFWHLDLLKLLPFMRRGPSRVVLYLHGIEAWRRQSSWLRRLLDRVDLFLSNSGFTWQRFIEFNPGLASRPHRVIHLGIEDFPLPAGTRKSLPAVLMIGRLVRAEDYKGHREMIRAWPHVLREIPQAQLWIAGDGDLRPELEDQVASSRLDASIRFFGRVTEERKLDLLAGCRCLALPSRGEGFGLVYLEAMRGSRPCLVSDQDAGREVVNPPEAGLAVDPADVHALAAATVRLLTPGADWDSWSRAARARYERHFTLGHFRRRLLSAVFGEQEVQSPSQ